MDLTNTACICPAGLYMSTIPLPASNYRNQPNDIWSAELNVRPPKVNNTSPFLRDYSTTPGVGCGFLYFRSKAVLGLSVSTTSYSRYAVSTIQSPISTSDNDRSLTDSDGAKTTRNPVLLPYLYTICIPRPVSSFHQLHICITQLTTEVHK